MYKKYLVTTCYKGKRCPRIWSMINNHNWKCYMKGNCKKWKVGPLNALKTFLTLALDEDEWTASHRSCCPPGMNSISHWIDGWFGPRASLDGVGEEQYLLLLQEFQPWTQPIASCVWSNKPCLLFMPYICYAIFRSVIISPNIISEMLTEYTSHVLV